jgi:hypothetical protein
MQKEKGIENLGYKKNVHSNRLLIKGNRQGNVEGRKEGRVMRKR